MIGFLARWTGTAALALAVIPSAAEENAVLQNLLTQGVKVDLPQARTAEPLDPKQPIVITVTKEGQLTVGDQTVAREDIAAEVRRLLDGEDRHVHVRGDREVAYGEIVAVMDHLAANGIVKIALLATGKSTGDSEPLVTPAQAEPQTP